MDYGLEHKKEKQDQVKSAVITFFVFLILLLVIYFYKIIQTLPLPQDQVVTTMLVNFGDNQNGSQTEEPLNQETSSAAARVEATSSSEIKEVAPPEKILTGNNVKVSTPKIEKTAPKISKSEPVKVSKATSSKTAVKKAQGDAKGNAAIGNLIKGRGSKAGSQGENGTSGNTGDPLGGAGNGDSKIGVDRKLISFIPGTMGRGGNQPSQKCTASGTINISYTVDKAGNVVSARRSSGTSDPCVVNTSINWVKTYVKAERASTSSTGIYKIVF